MNMLSMVGGALLGSSPIFIFIALGIYFSVARFSKHNKLSKIILASMILMLINTLGQISLDLYAFSLRAKDVDFVDVGSIFAIAGVIKFFVYMASLALLLYAAFYDRNDSTDSPKT